MSERDATFTLREIAAATGLNDKTLSGRVKVMRRNGELPPAEGRKHAHYTYEEVKKIIKPRNVGVNSLRPAYVDALKRKLLNDGYPIKKKEATT